MAARATSLPGVTSQIEDFGLNVAPEPQILNDSILIIGTAADGPAGEPIPILSKTQAQEVFGSFGKGTLVRGIFEALDATTEGTPDIRGMRIGDGQKATLEIAERLSTSSPWDLKTSGHNSIKLEALFAGAKYNAVSIFLDENKNINIYNPKTGVYSKFSYDDVNPNNNQVDARNVKELVEAINNDPNTSSIIKASASGIEAQYEISINTGTSGVALDGSKLVLDLRKILQGYGTSSPVLATGYILSATTSKTAGNLLEELEEVYSLSVSTPSLLETKGRTTVNVELDPFDGKGDSRFNTIQALEDYNSDNIYFHKPSGGAVVSEYMHFLNREVLPDVTTTKTNHLKFKQELAVKGWYLSPDDSQEKAVMVSGTTPSQTVTAKNGVSRNTTGALRGTLALAHARSASGDFYSTGYVLNNFDNTYAALSDYVKITASGIASAFTNPGKVIVEVSSTGGQSDSEWSQLFYHAVSGVYVSGFVVAGTTGTMTLALGWNASGYTGVGSAKSVGLLNSSGHVVKDKYVRITCNTVKGFLSEAETLPNLQAANSDWTTYFFRGKELIFSDTAPFDTVVNYGTKTNYEPGSDVVITDAHNGEIKFVSSTQPGPAGAQLSASQNSIIGLKYIHLPQFPSITTAANSLAGGSDGTTLSNGKLYDQLTSAYDALENYEVQIVVPMGAYIDSTKSSFNQITGLPQDVNAEFQVQLDEFLESHSINVKESIGVLGVEPLDTVSLAKVKDWVKRLTETNLGDPLRSANIMPLLESRYINIVAFEPVFDNLGGIPYTANGQAAYAGMISSLQPHHSPTNKPIPNALRTRFDLSNSQLEALSGMRYVTMRRKPGKNPVITDAVTAAPKNSDFVRLSTLRITFAAMDVVRKVCDPFIGQPNTPAKRNAMEAAITKGLHSMVEVGALNKFSFNLGSSPTQQVQGFIDVDLVLVPVFEIRRVRAKVRLRVDIPQTA